MVRPTVSRAAAFLRRNCLAPIVAVVLAATLHVGAPAAHAGSATLTWGAPTTNNNGSALTNLAGYKVYVGTASGSYQPAVNVGNVTSYSLSNLTDGSTYYFAVSAYNTSGIEGAKSAEVSKSLASTQPTSYTISATAGAGGTVTALNNSATNTATNGTSTITSVTVTAGANQSFAITPASGYTVASLSVDGAAVAKATSYTFSSVKANHTISATFAASTTGTTAPSTTPIFSVNSGGSHYAGTDGVSYMTDTAYSGGVVRTNTATISGTTDPTLYRSERSGNFSYTIPAANGSYALTLKFVETYWTAAGKRIFNVAVNGQPVISNLDLYAKVGQNKAYDVTLPVSVTNGTLTVTFTSVVDYAKVCALALRPAK